MQYVYSYTCGLRFVTVVKREWNTYILIQVSIHKMIHKIRKRLQVRKRIILQIISFENNKDKVEHKTINDLEF